jgi:magnesium chelatase family protein
MLVFIVNIVYTIKVINKHRKFMSSKIYSATLLGLETYIVEIEVDISHGKQSINIVGLPDASIQESKKRIMAAIRNTSIILPDKYITLNLAPADLKKMGTGFDLPMAMGILHATGFIDIPKSFLEETLFIGEVGLDGSLKPTSGIFSIAVDAIKLGKKRIILPNSSSMTTSLDNLEILCVDNIMDLILYFKGKRELKPLGIKPVNPTRDTSVDFSEISGQYMAKRALQIAAAGNHHSIFMGPPGSGKTMLAQRLPTIMPVMKFNEMLEVTRIYSSSGLLSRNEFISTRPFRSPHHTISYGGLVGGGSKITPGEITLSHKGILFLDEITEFTKKTLEVLRQPLEEKTITISRASSSLTFPADFLMVAAFNPCPCGFAGDATKRCACPKLLIDNYLKKLSGPFLDRIDLQLTLQPVHYSQTLNPTTNKSSEQMYKEMEHALAIQEKRGIKNGNMSVHDIQEYCKTTDEAQNIIKLAFDKLNLSMRGYHKILKVSRTIADIENKEMIEASHIKEALSYRQIDQKIANILYL